jgi:putative FmdB family regulatory protein
MTKGRSTNEASLRSFELRHSFVIWISTFVITFTLSPSPLVLRPSAMPIYEYLCRACNQPFEWLTREGEKPTCPACGKQKVIKQISVPVAHTKANMPPCPAKSAGMCGMSGCPSGGCGFGPGQ